VYETTTVCLTPSESKPEARFTSLEDSSIPVFPIERSIKNHSIRRRQVPVCAAFSLTDYETQGQTFSKALLDLMSKGSDSHHEFCSLYIEIGLLTTSTRKDPNVGYQQKNPSGSDRGDGEIASLRKTDTSTMAYKHGTLRI
jgi:hypothetical protein